MELKERPLNSTPTSTWKLPETGKISLSFRVAARVEMRFGLSLAGAWLAGRERRLTGEVYPPFVSSIHISILAVHLSSFRHCFCCLILHLLLVYYLKAA